MHLAEDSNINGKQSGTVDTTSVSIFTPLRFLSRLSVLEALTI